MALSVTVTVATPVPVEVAAPARRGRRVPVLVWALVAVHTALMLGSAMLYPAMYGYDEPQHVDMAYSYSKGNGVLGPGERWLANGVRNGERGPAYPPSRPFSDHSLMPRSERLGFDAQGGDVPYQAGLPNQMVQHPPLTYVLGAGVLSVPGVSALAYDKQIWLLRLLCILMVAPLPLLAWAAAAALLGPGPPALAAAVLPLALPGLTRVGASFSNDAPMILVGGLLAYLLARVLAGDLRGRTGAAVGGVLAAGLLTKGFALVLPPVAALAYLVAWFRFRRVPLGAAAWVVGLSAAGGLWWLRNLLLYGAVQPLGVGPGNEENLTGPPRPGGRLADFVPGFLSRMSDRTWGGIGLPDGPRLSPWVTTTWSVALLVLVAVGLVVGRRRAALAVLLLPGVLTLGLVGVAAWQVYADHVGIYLGVHGRYLYVAVAGVAVAFGLGLARILGRWAPLVLLVAALATQAQATRTLVGLWWAPRSAAGNWAELTGALGGIGRWSPWPAVVTYAPFVLVLLLVPIALVAAAGNNRATPDGDAPSGGRRAG